MLVAALQLPGGEAALFERLRDSSAVVILDNCEHVVDAAAELVGSAVRQLLRACGWCAPARSHLVWTGRPVRARAARSGGRDELFMQGALEANGARVATRRAATLCRPSTACRSPSSSRRPGPRRCRSRRSPGGSTTASPLPDPSSRRAERRRSPLDHQVELRPPVSRRTAGSVGPVRLCGRCAAVGRRSRPRGARRAGRVVVDVVGPAGQSASGDPRDEGAGGGVRYRLRDSIRAFALEALAVRGRPKRRTALTRIGTRSGRSVTDGVRGAEQAEHLRSP